jgi:hypothetical protein
MDAATQELVVRGLFGLGGLVAGFAGGWISYYWKTKNQRADYEDLKRTRRLKATKEDERIERAAKVKEIMIDLAKHNIPHEKLLEMLPMIAEGGGKSAPVEVDEGEVLDLAVPPSLIAEVMQNIYTEIFYWQLVEEQNACERGESEWDAAQCEKMKKAVEACRETVGSGTIHATPEERLIAQGMLAGLMWITGAKISTPGSSESHGLDDLADNGEDGEKKDKND